MANEKPSRDLVSKLTPEERASGEQALRCIAPEDSKYRKASQKLEGYLSADAEWKAFALVQKTLLETRVEFGQASPDNLAELDAAVVKLDALNASLLEDDKSILHDQLALLEELGRHVSEETKALLHPGTTSYDIVDTARSYLFRNAWQQVIRPAVAKSIEKLCELAEKSEDTLQVGRTHLQNTSPVPLGATFAGYAARMAERVERCDMYFRDLRGKVAGIVGTGASMEMIVGEGRGIEFETKVLAKLGLKSDDTATQVTQKERLADVGHGLTTLMHVLGDFSNDTRMLYSSAIKEVASRDNSERLGGSSADAGKDNPIQYENMCGKITIVESGMRVLYEMIHSDFQRDLRSSVMARYQPQAMMVQTFEAFSRFNKALGNLSINEDKIAANLQPVRDNPSEAMVAILRGEGWVHPEYGVGHDFVKKMAQKAKKEGRPLREVCLDDSEFKKLYTSLSETKRDILAGHLEKYTGFAEDKMDMNIAYAMQVARLK